MKKRFPWMSRGLILFCMFGLFSLGAVSYNPRAAMAQQLTPAFFLTYFQSHNEPAKMNPGGSEATVTAVTISSLGSAVECAVKIEWRDFTGTMQCTTESDRIISRGFVTHCTRPFKTMAANFPKCDVSCVPPLLKNEGPAIVSVTTGCENTTGVDVRTFYTAYVAEPPDTEIVISGHGPQVFKIRNNMLE